MAKIANQLRDILVLSAKQQAVIEEQQKNMKEMDQIIRLMLKVLEVHKLIAVERKDNQDLYSVILPNAPVEVKPTS